MKNVMSYITINIVSIMMHHMKYDIHEVFAPSLSLSLTQGFYEVIPQDLIKIFDENELEVKH